MNKKKPIVLVIEEVYKKGKAVFDTIADMEVMIAPVDEDSLAIMVKEKKAFAVVLGVEKYTGSLYEAMKKGGIIARFGVGCDGVDFEKAKQKRLFVTNTPGVLESTVAEFTIFLAGEVLRKPGKANEEMKKGTWGPVKGYELKGKIWLILGLGKIGKKLSQILAFGFGVEVFALEISRVEPEKIKAKYGVEKVSSDFSEMAPFADIVSLHLPVNKNTNHFLNSASLGQLKPGAVLINTGRGSLIDENALYDALQTGHVSGAGLDVFEIEPYKPVNPNKDLRELSNVVLTPHIASSALECNRRMAERVMQNIQLVLEEKYDKMDIISG
jgi:lactate dehydrogenase-like 2-hydroxyacid dehydrogenase